MFVKASKVALEPSKHKINIRLCTTYDAKINEKSCLPIYLALLNRGECVVLTKCMCIQISAIYTLAIMMSRLTNLQLPKGIVGNIFGWHVNST